MRTLPLILLLIITSCVTLNKPQGEPPAYAMICRAEEHWDIPKGPVHSLTALRGKLWVNKDVLRVQFIRGERWMYDIAMVGIKEWERTGRIRFEEVESGADWVWAFDEGRGSWSALGTDCARKIEISGISGNMGWFRQLRSRPDYLRQCATHESGHSLGYGHEQQMPSNNWYVLPGPAYTFYMGAPNFMSKDAVDQNVVNRYAPNQLENPDTDIDKASVMFYWMPAHITSDGLPIPFNFVPSVRDLARHAAYYPYRVVTVPVQRDTVICRPWQVTRDSVAVKVYRVTKDTVLCEKTKI